MIIERRKLEYYHNIIALLLIGGGIPTLFSVSLDSRSESNPFNQIILILFTLHAVIYCCRRPKAIFAQVLQPNAVFICFFGYLFASVLWSADSMLTFRRQISFMLSLLFVFYLLHKYDFEHLIEIFYQSLKLILIFTWIAVLFGVGVHHGDGHDGLIKGFSGNKNNLGLFMALGTVLSLVYLKIQHKRIDLVFTLGFLVTLLATGSKTSLACVFIAVFFMTLVYYMTFGRWPWSFSQIKITSKLSKLFVSYFSFIMIICTFVFVLPVVVQMLGRELTFTGRATIWEYALIIFQDFQLFGAGYRSFWIDKLTADFYFYNPYWENDDGMSGIVGNGHSGYMDVMLELGLVGIVFWSVCLFVAIHSVFKYVVNYANGELSVVNYSLAIVFMMLVYNFFETNWLHQRGNLGWLLFLVIVFKVRKAKYDQETSI
ncbi:O-antigen ligase family protein [Catenovulum maritimum]|uniref:O-antigen ligase-related domain-containing protein n=1 Tax=Catenovulum maritimum TaxID=1513271 RepID=A0A0J8GNQ1_9ALTE|nr:O-antigen ligase family protein [Catenovulum maritimum]KMT64455.1 hypothetical protein XM47_14275 [Catenovulum maritimum]